MNDSALLVLWQVAFFGFGALGLVAIGAFPLRSYEHARRFVHSSKPGLYTSATVLASLAAAAFAAQPLVQLGKCLLGYHCSANAAGGWINSIYLGVVYGCFEFGLLVLRKVESRHRNAT
jgi:hypothetical protein